MEQLTHCMLCGDDVAALELHSHRSDETREVIEYTINMIKSRHPEWTREDPACRKCWEFYRSL